MEQWQPVFHTDLASPFGDRSVKRVIGHRTECPRYQNGSGRSSRHPETPFAGCKRSFVTLFLLFCVAGSKDRSASISCRIDLPGQAFSGGNMSRIPPRIAYSPGSRTVPALSNPFRTKLAQVFRSTRDPIKNDQLASRMTSRDGTR